MKLWTVQAGAAVDCLLQTGTLRGDWSRVDQAWRPYYRWLIQAADSLGFRQLAPGPPVWAWHSDGGWQAPPSSDLLLLLLGREPQPEYRPHLLELEVPSEGSLLTDYALWCDLFFDVDASDLESFELESIRFSERSRYAGQTLQACRREVLVSQVKRISLLELITTGPTHTSWVCTDSVSAMR